MKATTVPLLAAGVFLALGPLAAAAPPRPAALRPLSAAAWDFAKARHLLFRAGFGGSSEEVEKLHGMGLRKAVDFLVDYRSHPDAGTPAPEPPKDFDLSPAKLAGLS